MIRSVLAGIGLLAIGWVVWTWVRISREHWLEQERYETENPYR